MSKDIKPLQPKRDLIQEFFSFLQQPSPTDKILLEIYKQIGQLNENLQTEKSLAPESQSFPYSDYVEFKTQVSLSTPAGAVKLIDNTYYDGILIRNVSFSFATDFQLSFDTDKNFQSGYKAGDLIERPFNILYGKSIGGGGAGLTTIDITFFRNAKQKQILNTDQLTGNLKVDATLSGTSTIAIDQTGTNNDVEVINTPTIKISQTGDENKVDLGTSDLIKETTTLTEATVTLSNMDTEFSYSIPSNTKWILFRLKAEGQDLRYAFTSGKVAGSTDTFFNLRKDEVAYIDKLNLSSKTIYFATTLATGKVEILSGQ